MEASSVTSMRLRTCFVLLVGLVAVCLLSRMSMSEGSMGSYARWQVRAVVDRVTREGSRKAQISRQDSDLLVALLNNVDATARFQAAKLLAEEAGLRFEATHGAGMQDHLTQLAEEQETLVLALSGQMEAAAA